MATTPRLRFEPSRGSIVPPQPHRRSYSPPGTSEILPGTGIHIAVDLLPPSAELNCPQWVYHCQNVDRLEFLDLWARLNEITDWDRIFKAGGGGVGSKPETEEQQQRTEAALMCIDEMSLNHVRVFLREGGASGDSEKPQPQEHVVVTGLLTGFVELHKRYRRRATEVEVPRGLVEVLKSFRALVVPLHEAHVFSKMLACFCSPWPARALPVPKLARTESQLSFSSSSPSSSTGATLGVDSSPFSSSSSSTCETPGERSAQEAGPTTTTMTTQNRGNHGLGENLDDLDRCSDVLDYFGRNALELFLGNRHDDDEDGDEAAAFARAPTRILLYERDTTTSETALMDLRVRTIAGSGEPGASLVEATAMICENAAEEELAELCRVWNGRAARDARMPRLVPAWGRSGIWHRRRLDGQYQLMTL